MKKQKLLSVCISNLFWGPTFFVLVLLPVVAKDLYNICLRKLKWK